MADPGRLALRKERTGRSIRGAAMRLFLSRGFDQVTTTDVARASGVSPATVFNYFKTKEDLFFGEVLELELALAGVVRSCQPGESVWWTLRRHVLHDVTAGRAYSDPAAVAPFHRLVGASPRLQAREHEIGLRRESVLAEALADAFGLALDAVAARIAAALYVTAERLVTVELRRRLSGGADPEQVLDDLEPFIDEVFRLLEAGIGKLVRVEPGRPIA